MNELFKHNRLVFKNGPEIIAPQNDEGLQQQEQMQETADVQAEAVELRQETAEEVMQAETSAESAPETLVYNKQQFVEGIFQHLKETMGPGYAYSLIRYEVKGTKAIDGKDRDLSLEEIENHFSGKELSKIFVKGVERAKEDGVSSPTLEDVVKHGLTWYEYDNRKARLSKLPNTPLEKESEEAEKLDGSLLDKLKEKKAEVQRLLSKHKEYQPSDWRKINVKLARILTGERSNLSSSKAVISALQQELKDAGYRIGTDGKVGINTLNTIAKYLGLKIRVKRAASAKPEVEPEEVPQEEGEEDTKAKEEQERLAEQHKIKSILARIFSKGLGKKYLASPSYTEIPLGKTTAIRVGVNLRGGLGRAENRGSIGRIEVRKDYLLKIGKMSDGMIENSMKNDNLIKVYDLYGRLIERGRNSDSLADRLALAHETAIKRSTNHFKENPMRGLNMILSSQGYKIKRGDVNRGIFYLTKKGSPDEYEYDVNSRKLTRLTKDATGKTKIRWDVPYTRDHYRD